MSSRSTCYRRAPGLRVRPAPEVGRCFVYTPARPRLYALNMSAWLILELCQGRSPRALARAYRKQMEDAHWRRVGPAYFCAPAPPSPAALETELRDGLRLLQQQGIVQLANREKQHAKKA